ncbi:unnamed protein product, partial [marine sediment metagenome]
TRFIYSSSQSMYGISKITDELDEDESEKNPLTAYAKTKWDAECSLKKLGDDEYINRVTPFFFASLARFTVE